MHQHQVHTRNEYPFMTCQNPANCNPAAHGNIEVWEGCRCGAVRVRAVNQQHVEQGPWRSPAN